MDERDPSVLDELALHHARRSFAELQPEQTVEHALASIREQTLDSAIVYFYVVDADRQLKGVVPTRRLLTAAPEATIASLMTPATVTLPSTATLRDAAVMLVDHRLLALPIVGTLGRMLGVIDASTLGGDVTADVTGQRRLELFQLLGVRVAELGGRWRSRMSALGWNIVGGLIAAAVAAAHEDALREVAALALFMPVTLALSESIGMQAVAIALETPPPPGSGVRILSALRVETGVAIRLAIVSAALVAVVSLAWQREWTFAVAVLAAIAVAMTVAALVGTIVPRLLYRWHRNPTVASGPAVLAIADFVTLVVYFGVATSLLTG